jgi:hypothetical protein
MTDPVLAPEAAEAEFARWVSAMGLVRKLDTSRLNDEDAKSLADQKRLLLDAIEDGHLVVNDNGEFVYTPCVGDRSPLTFFEPTGASLMATDQVKSAALVQKQFNMLGAVTGTSAKRFALMKQRDLNVCLSILALFLAR